MFQPLSRSGGFLSGTQFLIDRRSLGLHLVSFLTFTFSAIRLGRTIADLDAAERKAIAREYRLAAKRVKKKAKADAKRARKENAILHRRMVCLTLPQLEAAIH